MVIPAERWDGFVVDLDGVVWRGAAPIRGSTGALRRLAALGKRLVYVTNDPRESRAHYAARLRALGVDVADDDVITAAAATAALVAGAEPGRRAFAIGSAALKGELAGAGVDLVDGTAAREADIVVVGGHDSFSYAELKAATQALRRGARLYAAGRDAVFPMDDGPWPGTGSILAAVEVAGGRDAVVVGKPEPFMFQLARERLVGCERIAVVGDTLASDIAGGRAAGFATVLVLTGNTDRDAVAAAETQPDVVLADLAALAGN